MIITTDQKTDETVITRSDGSVIRMPANTSFSISEQETCVNFNISENSTGVATPPLHKGQKYAWQTFAGQEYPWQTFVGQKYPWQKYTWQTKPWQTFMGQEYPWQTFVGENISGDCPNKQC